MKRTAQCLPAILFCGLIATTGGCKREDPEHLSGIGHRIGAKLGAVLNKSNDRLTLQWRGGGEQLPPVDMRVQERLRWDNVLQGTAIQVTAQDAVVELRGTVATSDQRQYAVELARTTVGVERVVEYLVVGTAAEQQLAP
jgi:hypothetical protein